MSNIYRSGEDFLNKKYKELFFSDIVESIKDNSDTRDEALRKYLKLLEETHNNVYSSKRESDRNLLKRLYYSKYIIKPEDITENYWNYLNQQYITEIGYELNEELKQKHIETIIKDQKASLDAWIDYLSCDDSKFYPMWAKYWAFQGMLTIGTYDNKNEIYKKRTKDTVAPFIELNQEVLAKCIDYIVKYVEHNEVEEKDLEQIITSGNFFKLYTVLLSKFKEITYDRESIDGIWVKYDQGDNYQELYNSLQGYATGWCTAGEDTCKNQIKGGDFYVYYTYDKEGNPKIPRIAIRMDGKNRIGEIRGVAKDQNLESHLEDVLEEKLKEFPDRDNYKQRLEDQKKMTFIYEKHKKNIELSKEDLIFLYEIKKIILSFGYCKDPRIEEILSYRNIRKDYAYIFGYKEEEIASRIITFKRNPKKYKVLLSSYETDETVPENIVLPELIKGYLSFHELKKGKNLKLPKTVIGDINFHELEDVNGLVIKNINCKGIRLPKVESIYGLTLELPEWCECGMCLSSLKSAKGLKLPKKYISYLDLSGLKTAEGLELPDIVGELWLYNIKNANNLKLPRKITKSLQLNGIDNPENLILPETIGENLYLNGLVTTKKLKLPKKIGGCLSLNGLKNVEGLDLVTANYYSLSLCGLKIAKGLMLPKRIEGSLFLDGLESIENLVLPEYIGEQLSLNAIKGINKFILPKSVSCLSMSNLETAIDLQLPDEITGNVYLYNLNYVKRLNFPKKVGGSIYLVNLKSAKGVKFPEEVGNNLYLHNLQSSEGLELSENFDLDKLFCPEHIKQELIEKRNKNIQGTRRI